MTKGLMDTNSTEIIECGQRVDHISWIYLFLSKSFSYPKMEFYNFIADEQIDEQIRALVTKLPFEVNFNGISSPRLQQEEFESLYTNSFDLGFGGSVTCSLYESDYIENDKSSRDIIEELLLFYDHFGVKLNEKEKDFPDNLVVELEFMSFLTNKEANAVKRGNDPTAYRIAQLDFLERHLDKWVHKLNQLIQKNVQESFYKGASVFMAEFIRNHFSYLCGYSTSSGRGKENK